jgi:hypothetical protein
MAAGHLLQLRGRDAVAVIPHLHLPASRPDLHLNAGGLGIEGIFQQFPQSSPQRVDHLSCCHTGNPFWSQGLDLEHDTHPANLRVGGQQSLSLTFYCCFCGGQQEPCTL